MNSSSVQLGRFSSAILWVLLICVIVLPRPPLAQAQDPAVPLWVPGEFIIKFNTEKLQQLRHLLPGLDKLTDEDLKDALTDSLGAERRDELPLIEADAIKVTTGEDTNGTRASFSNYGATTVDVAAPGVNISSSVRGGGYSSMSGTSMATPHVSGVAALMNGCFPQYSPADAKAQRMASVKPIGMLNGLMVSPGIVNALAAIADPSNFPPELVGIPNSNSRSGHPGE